MESYKRKEQKNQTHRKRDQTCGYQRQRGGGRGNCKKMIKRYKLQLIRYLSTREVMYNMMITPNVAVRYI